MPIISTEIMRTIDKREKNKKQKTKTKNNKRKTNRDRKEPGEQKLQGKDES